MHILAIAPSASRLGAFPVAIAAGQRPWWRSPLALVSLLLHAALLGTFWWMAQTSPSLPAEPKSIALILAKMAPPPTPAPPPPLQKPAPPVSRQLALTAPRPAPVPLPVHTTAAAPEQAEVRTPGKPEALPPVVAAAAAVDAPVARAAVPGPRTISTEGIPSDYVNQVFDRINRRVVYPRGARLRGEQGRVAYRLTLNQQGELLKLDIQPCGSDELDQAASKAIKAAAPFPKLPDLGGTSYLLAGSIQFSLNAL